MVNIAYPFQFDGRGRTKATDYERHIRDLVHQVLFTSPGERVMRPGFGSGIRQLVFAPAGSELASATEMLVQASLQEWLGNLLIVNAIAVRVEDAQLQVSVNFTVRASQEQLTVEIAGGTVT